MKKVVAVSMLAVMWASTLWAAQPGEWKKVKESDGIIGWTRSTPLSPVDECRAEGIIDAPVPVVEAIVRDTTTMKRYMFMCSDAFEIKDPSLKTGKDFYYMYFRQGMPWPVSDRYGVGSMDWMLDRTPGGVLVRGKNVTINFTPPVKNAVQMPVVRASWRMEPAGEHKTKMTYLCLAAPGGNLPSSVVNFMIKNIGVATIKEMRNLAKEEPYRGARTILTTTPYHE